MCPQNRDTEIANACSNPPWSLPLHTGHAKTTLPHNFFPSHTHLQHIRSSAEPEVWDPKATTTFAAGRTQPALDGLVVPNIYIPFIARSLPSAEALSMHCFLPEFNMNQTGNIWEMFSPEL